MKKYQIWSIKMSLFSAKCLILKDEYTDEEMELNKFLINNCMDLVFIDERSDNERALIPTEIAIDRFVKQYTTNVVSHTGPKKINVEKIDDDVRQTDTGDEQVHQGPADEASDS